MKEFTKSDLKNRMVVEYRNGTLRLVVGDILIGKGGYLSLSGDYKENLTHRNGETEFDIVKIYDIIYNLDHLENIGKLDLLWQRSEIKEVTMTEVEEKFGCKVKIVKE